MIVEDDDEPLPLDLDAIARHYHLALGEDMSGIPEHSREALAAVSGLLARVHDLQEELAYWRGLPLSDPRRLIHGGGHPKEDFMSTIPPVITPEIAAHVLQHIGAAEEPAGRPDLFTRWLIADLVDDPDATMDRIGAYAHAVHQAATEDGVQRLQEIALTAPVQVGGEHRG